VNDAQLKDYFKATFNAVADGYDGLPTRFFPQSAEQIVSFLNLNGDEQILDVATGTGWVALAAAKQLTQGHVNAIDLSEGMLAQAQQKQQQQNLSNITFTEMDMQNLEFADHYFDVAISAFSLFFVEDMTSQLQHVASKVKTKGQVITSTFYDDAFSPLASLFLDRLATYGIEIPSLAWKRIATKEQCTTIFYEAGMHDISCHQINSGYYFRDADDWWHMIWNAGFRGLVAQLSDDDLIKFKQEHLAEVNQLATDDGIWLQLDILYTIGSKSTQK
jgi:ubiquinone/menaquinone biosynthesis C-methylase UbiE